MTFRVKPDSCIGCDCHSHGTDFSAIEGTGSLGVMLVGEASGEHEQREGLPFRPGAPAGGVLTRILRGMGLSREQFSITNVLRCRPRNNWLEKSPWEHQAIIHCRPNLEQAILERKPKVIVALGGTAMRELTGMAGEAQGIGHLAGYVVPCRVRPQPQIDNGIVRPEMLTQNYIPVIGNFHPAYLRRGKASHQGIFARILKRAINIAAGRDHDWLWGDPEEHSAQLNYTTRPTAADAHAFAEHILGNPAAVVSYDLETSESASLDEDARDGFADTHIRLVQFAVEGRGAIAIPWEPVFVPAISAILRSPNPKCGHNVWLFDNKVLRAAGQREGLDLTPQGTIHDTLAMFHHWQPDLPAHLQAAASFVQFPFPWKHLGHDDSTLPFYGCCDVDATLRLYTMLEKTLRRDQVWGDDVTGYLGQVNHVRPVLAGMEDRGLPVDDAARVALAGEFDIAQAALGREITALAPKECGRVHPKEGYKGVPPEIRNHDMLDGTPIRDTVFYESGDDGERYRYEEREFAILNADLTATSILRWCRVYDFNPNSSRQLINYMRVKSHPVPKDKHREADDGSNPDTTNKKELVRLANKTGDTFYLKVIEFRELTKAKGTYVDGFKPAADGRVHTTFTFDTAIAQLSSRNPNIQNFPKHGSTESQRRLVKALRKMIAAEPGKVLVEWDYKSCHVLTLGFLAEDYNYMRLARLDMHSFVAGHLLGCWDGHAIFPETDDQLRTRFKWLKSDPERKRVRDDPAKHGILGIGNGLQAKGLFERYMESFPARPCTVCQGRRTVAGVRGPKKCPACHATGVESGQRLAERVLEIARQLFPKVFAYQRREQEKAHKEQFLLTPFGHLRRFYEVFRWDPRKMDLVHGDQAEEAIAYRLSNVAHSHMRESMKAIARAGFDERYGMCNQIHDALLFHFDRTLLDEHVRDIHPILVAPSTVLRHPAIAPDGLSIEVEASVGENWAEMAELPLPKKIQVDALAPAR